MSVLPGFRNIVVSNTRTKIIEAADTLFYQRGFEYTSFADLADMVQISRGNFYHHFRTKDEILAAVIAIRAEITRAMLQKWEDAAGDNPADAIRSFIQTLLDNRTDIKRYGCPVGTLTLELAKLNHGASGEAKAVFTLIRRWLAKQFRALGRKTDADALALHLLVRSQGVATVVNCFHNDTFVRREVEAMCDWLDARVLEMP